MATLRDGEVAGSNIPIVDIQPLLGGVGTFGTGEAVGRVVKEIREACLKSGFFYVKNHGIDKKIIESLEELAHNFFNLPLELKNKIHMKHSGLHWKGYFAVGEELTSGKPDNKEGLYFGEEYSIESEPVLKKWAMHGPNQFPEPYDVWKTAVLRYMDALTNLGHLIMSAIALSLQLPADFFESKFCNPKAFTPFRIFRYPGGSDNFGVGRHTDYGVLTILKQDDVGGLQVEDRVTKKWVDAPPIKDTFVVNIGDMMQLWTDGLYKATPHRVKPALNRDRVSMPFFFDPAFDTKILVEDIRVARTSTSSGDRDAKTVKLTNASGETDKELSKEKAEAIRYGDYITHKVAGVFPELFKDSFGVDVLRTL